MTHGRHGVKRKVKEFLILSHKKKKLVWVLCSLSGDILTGTSMTGYMHANFLTGIRFRKGRGRSMVNGCMMYISC